MALMAQSNGSRSASNPVNFCQFLSLETVNPNQEKTEHTEVHGTNFFDGSTLTRLCDGVWPPIPSGRASIIAARMDASRNRRNASLWRAGTPAYGGNMSSWSVILMTARCGPSMVALMPGWVLARSAPIQFR